MLKIIFKLDIRVHSLMDITGRIKTRIDDSHAPSGIQYLILLYIIITIGRVCVRYVYDVVDAFLYDII